MWHDMTYSDYLATGALFISLLSFAISIYSRFLDRMNVYAESKYYPSNPDYDRAHLNIKVVNKGRRIAILTLLGGDVDNGSWQGSYLGKERKGLHLAEHEFYETKFYIDDLDAMAPDSEGKYVVLWFEDSLGRRHIVRKSKQNIDKLLKS